MVLATLPSNSVPRKTAHVLEDESLSEEIDEVSVEIPELKKESKKRRHEEIPWVTKYEPSTVSEVSINPRKVKEVREVFGKLADKSSDCRLLVLSGPSGCSKSTLAKCLAKEYFPSDGTAHGYVEYLDSSLTDVNQAQHFREFMDGCRYLVGSNRKVVLIEDLPNVFHEDTLFSLRDCLRSWIFSANEIELPPVVLCLTEIEIVGDHGQRGFYNIENCLTVETVLGRDLLNSGCSSGLIRRVKFLPVAKTYIKKSLQRILSAEKGLSQTAKSPEFLNQLYESGDIRSSISNLEFISRSSHGPGFSGLFRESQISLFHAAGKVIHSSSKTRDGNIDSEYGSDYESVKMVVDNYHNTGLLHLALLENYQIYNGSQFDIDIAATIVDNLSLHDTFTSPEAAQDFAIRATRHELAKVPVKSSRTLPMKFPRQFKMVREANKVRFEVANYVRYLGGMGLSFSDANLIDGYYVPRIMNSAKHQRLFGTKQFTYNRIGGSFREIYADEDLPVMENENEAAQSVKDQFSEDIRMAVQEEHEHANSDSEESDAIEESTDEDPDDLNDTLDDHILSFSTQTQSMKDKPSMVVLPKTPLSNHSTNAGQNCGQEDTDDEFSDDPELAFLVSQGKL
ncbi:hypothetical protein OXX69_009819 [Metschnikowia pulcherrima]